MKIPSVITSNLEDELNGIRHGTVTLQLHVRDNAISRFVVTREKSVFVAKSKDSATEPVKK